MQARSIYKYTIPERLHKLRLKEQLTWEQLALSLGLTVAMLHHVRRGIRNLSQKAQYRLEHAEINAGLRSPTSRKSSSSTLEDSDLEIGLNRLRRKLSVLDSASKVRFFKAMLQIADGIEKKK